MKNTVLKIMYAVICIAVAVALSIVVFSDEKEASPLFVCTEIVGNAGSFEGIDIPDDAVLFSAFPQVDEDDDTENTENIDPQDTEKDEDVKEKLGLPSAEGVSQIMYFTQDDRDYIRAGKVSSADSLKLTFNLADYVIEPRGQVIGMGLFVQGSDDSETRYSKAKIKLEVFGGTSSYTVTFPVAANVPMVIYFSSDDFIKDFKIEKLVVEASNDGNYTMSSLRLTEPFVTQSRTLSFAKNNKCVWMSVLEGRATFADNVMKVATADGVCSVAVGTESYGVPDENYVNTVRYVEIGASSGHGSVAVEGAYTVAAGSPFRNIDGEGKTAVIKLVTESVLGNIFEFKSSSNEDVTVNKINFTSTKENVEAGYQPLTQLSVVDGKLHGEGSLDSDTVKEHRKKMLGIYMVPAVGGEPILIGKTGVATRFSFDISLEAYPHAMADYMFYVAIVDADGKIYRAGETMFVASSTVRASSNSVYALYGVDPIAVYESGTPTVMIDVDIAELTDIGNSGSTTVTRGGYVYGFSNKYLRTLDSGMEFYMTSDVAVYLRLICTKEIKSRVDGTLLTYPLSGDEVLLRSDTPEAAGLYSAIAAFMSERYPGICSIVLGSAVNSGKLTGISTTDAYKYASDIAMASRFIYSAASEYSDVFVTLPLITDGVFISPEMIVSLISEKLTRVGSIPFAVMYTSDKCEFPAGISTIGNSLYLNGTANAIFNVFCYEPYEKYDNLTDDYKNLCLSASQSNVKTVFLSENGLEEKLSIDALNVLKKEMMSNSSVFVDSVAISADDFDMEQIKGYAYMWDFTSAGSKLGWIPGYGISAMSTAKATALLDPSDERVLRCITTEGEESAAGIMMCRYPMALNLADAPYLEFVYKFTANNPVNIVFVFGNGENRGEYAVPADIVPDEDGKYRAVCDLSEFASRSTVAYVGIIIYSDEKVTFDLTSVRAMSKTLDNEGVEALITKLPEVEKTQLPIVRITVVVVISAVVLIAVTRVLIVLKRYDKTLVNVVKKRRRY